MRTPLRSCSQVRESRGDCDEQKENYCNYACCIDNKVENRIFAVCATWYIDNESFGSAGRINADYATLGEESIQLCIKEADVPEGSDLEKFAVEIEIAEVSGKTVEVATLQFPLKFGRDYFYELRYEDGEYLILRFE